MSGGPLFQQALDELLQVQLLLLVLPPRPQLPEGSGSQGPEKAGLLG